MNEACSLLHPSPSASTQGAPAPTRDLEGKVCLVVGGGGMRESSCWNIGMEIAMAYGLAGARVMVTDVREEAASEAAKLIRQSGGQSAFCRMDVGEEESVRGAVAATLDAFGTVDVLHNNVGIGKAGASSQTSAEDWRRIADTNLLGLHLTTQGRAACDDEEALRCNSNDLDHWKSAVRRLSASRLWGDQGGSKPVFAPYSGRIRALWDPANTLIVGSGRHAAHTLDGLLRLWRHGRGDDQQTKRPGALRIHGRCLGRRQCRGVPRL